jgi:phosphomannomutase
MAELKTLVRSKGCDFGIATDADGDRFGIVDHEGRVVIQNIVLALLLEHLVETRGWRGNVARSVATTRLLDRIAQRHGLPLITTPVGFKFLADLFIQDRIMFGGEESASIAVRGHLPEKDGILAGVLLAEMLASRGKKLAELVEDLFRAYGERFYVQKTIPLTAERTRKLKSLAAAPPAKLAGRPIRECVTIDGVRFDFDDDDWLLLRTSGTEPIVRCYAESGSRTALRDLARAGLAVLA